MGWLDRLCQVQHLLAAQKLPFVNMAYAYVFPRWKLGKYFKQHCHNLEKHSCSFKTCGDFFSVSFSKPTSFAGNLHK